MRYQQNLAEAALRLAEKSDRAGHLQRTAELAAKLVDSIAAEFGRVGLSQDEVLEDGQLVTLDERAWLAGILHDVERYGSGETPNFPADELEKRHQSSRLLHAALGAQWSWDRGLRDGGVLFAIRYHTIGHSEPTPLLCALMLADATEPGRAFPGLSRLRALMRKEPLAALKERLTSTTNFVKSKGWRVHPNALAQIEFLGQLAG
ncbi:HD domain-containing protein [bacterium]|nr:HD domain-containing protein [bacterium]